MHENQCFMECVYASEHPRLWTTTLWTTTLHVDYWLIFWVMCHETNFLQLFCIWQKSDCQMNSHAHSLILCWAMQKQLTYNIISLQHIPCLRFKFKGRNNLSKKFPILNMNILQYCEVWTNTSQGFDFGRSKLDIIEAVLYYVSMLINYTAELMILGLYWWDYVFIA